MKILNSSVDKPTDKPLVVLSGVALHGEYNKTTEYRLGDIVEYDNAVYAMHTVGQSIPTNKNNWQMLTKAIAGRDGDDGVSIKGEDGKSVELQRNSTHIQWRYPDGQWVDLISLSAFRGEDGKDGQSVRGERGLKGDKGVTGEDGKSINWLGKFVKGKQYERLDAVEYEGSSYVANSTVSNLLPDKSGRWDLMAKKGTDGQGIGYFTGTGGGTAGAGGGSGGAQEIKEYANTAAFPATGESSIIYIALDSNKVYRWGGSVYVEISASAVNSVNGRIGAVTGLAEQTSLNTHTANVSNPHTVTKTQVGLGSVDNTSDTAKPVSTAQDTADNLRVLKAGDTMTGVLNMGGNSLLGNNIPSGDLTLLSTSDTTKGNIYFGSSSGAAFDATNSRFVVPGMISGNTDGRGIRFKDIAGGVDLAGIQSLNLGGKTYTFFANNRYYSGSGWLGMDVTRPGCSFQLVDDSFTFFSWAANQATTFAYRFTVASGGNIGMALANGSPDSALTIGRVANTLYMPGTVATDGTTNLIGTGTDFTNRFRVGDTLVVTGETTRTITAIASSTNLTVSVAFTTTASLLTYRPSTTTLNFRVRSNGNVSIGSVVNPVHRLEFGAGTGEADGIGFGTDTNLYRSAADTLKTDDALVVDSTISTKAGTSTGQIAKVGGTINVNTTAVGNIGIGEDDLMTYSVPANTLSANTARIKFRASGTITNSINTKRLRVKFGATTIMDTGAAGFPVSAAIQWVLEGEVIRTGAATQKCSANLSTNNASLATYVGYSTAAETLSGAVIVKLTGEATSNDDIVQETMTVDYAPAP